VYGAIFFPPGDNVNSELRGSRFVATQRYTKFYFPLSKVKGKDFLSRLIGCKAVGFSFVRYKPGDGGAYVHRHRAQEEVFATLKGTGTIILDGRRHSMPQGTIVRVAPRVYRAIGNDSNRDVIFLIVGAVPPKNFPLGGRTLLGDGIPNRKKVPKWKKARRAAA
jgi:uncharacterized cupin superfamily protein